MCDVSACLRAFAGVFIFGVAVRRPGSFDREFPFIPPSRMYVHFVVIKSSFSFIVVLLVHVRFRFFVRACACTYEVLSIWLLELLCFFLCIC